MTHTDANQEIESHQGHELETGFLQRVREWTDLFPFLRLVRTLRMAAAPTLITVTALTATVWLVGVSMLSDVSIGRAVRDLRSASQPLSIAGLVWSLFIWAPTSIWLSRQGGLLTAKRTMMGTRAAMTMAFSRSWRGWSSAAIPLVAAFVIAIAIFPLGLVARMGQGQAWIEIPLGVFTALIAIPAGVIAFGALIAIPLSWAALGNEQDSDPLNALSRGYESLFRRPLHLAFYVAFAALIVWIILQITTGMANAGTLLALWVLNWTDCAPRVGVTATLVLNAVPMIVATTLGWGLVGGIYLLLRYETGGQEIEDLWEPDTPVPPPLPDLPTR